MIINYCEDTDHNWDTKFQIQENQIVMFQQVKRVCLKCGKEENGNVDFMTFKFVKDED